MGAHGWPWGAEEGWTNTPGVRRLLEKRATQKQCLGSRFTGARRSQAWVCDCCAASNLDCASPPELLTAPVTVTALPSLLLWNISLELLCRQGD